MSDKKFIAITVTAALVIVIGSYFLISKGNTQKVSGASYRLTDKDKPQLQVDKNSADLGKMKVSEQKSQDFMIKNVGSKPLQLTDITTSCGCTVGQVIYDGQTSEEFGMHSQSDYVGEIAPGRQATIRVTYRPYVMPVYGPVERELYATTNDPAQPKLTLKVTAQVH